MWEGAALLLIVAVVTLWIDSLRSRERAVEAGRRACARYGLQLLDDTVAIARLAFARDEQGQLGLQRTYLFEFSDDGNNRRRGLVVMQGGIPQDVQLEPYRISQ